MTSYAVGIDRGGIGDEKILNNIIYYLKQCSGGNVVSLGVGPSKVQNYGLKSKAKHKTGVYITNGVGLATPNDLAQSYYHYDHVIFVWPQYIGNQYMSDESIKNHIIPGEWDWNRASNWNVGGQTAAQWFSKNSKVDLVAGKTPQDIAQRICNQAFVTESGNPSSSTSSTGSNSGSSSSDGSASSSNVSPLLQGEMTFEELVGEICNGIDLLFLTKKSVIVVDDFESIYAEAKYLRDHSSKTVENEDIKFWQLEEDSYELEVNQHGFYNTVRVQYKNGVVTERYDEYVRVYGEIPITYKDPKIDKTTAEMKAKAYLAAHVRDFNMGINLTMLTEPEIDIGDIVTIDNPKTLNNKIRKSKGLDPEYLFVHGISTSWEGDGYISSDLELKIAPVSPQRLDVPQSGTATGQNASDGGSTSTDGNYNQCGLSSDKKTICAIGKASAPGESGKYGGGFYKSVFQNKCPFCGRSSLVWDIFWAGNESSDYGYSKCKGSTEGGNAEGHIFCKGCDADFSTIEGKDHMSPPRARLKRISGPTKSSKQEAYQLKKGIS